MELCAQQIEHMSLETRGEGNRNGVLTITPVIHLGNLYFLPLQL